MISVCCRGCFSRLEFCGSWWRALWLGGVAGLAGLLAMPVVAKEDKLRVLILSGANNHNWQETTPAIRAALMESGRFSVDVEDRVADMKPGALEPYAAIVSNFNLFGKDASIKVWDDAMRKAFIAHLAKGHGLVVVHAGGSVFYDWPEFQTLAIGSWKDATSHGAIHIDLVSFTGVASPVTAGLAPFYIRDEFWQDTGVAAGAKALATVKPPNAPKNDAHHNDIIFTHEAGGARGFAIILGHDATAMKNTAWRTLLQRGTEWAATGMVTVAPAQDWPNTRDDAERMTK